MRILFMGTDEFAICSLLKLIESKHKLIGVVTQPDRPGGRGRKLIASPVKKLATKFSIPIYQPKRVSAPDFVKTIRELEPELIIVVAYGQILKKGVLCSPSLACINIHPSLLPKYRGAAPIQRAIINGDKQTGVTIMLMDEGEDTGEIIAQKPVMIDDDDTAISLKDKLSKVAAKMLLEVVDLAQEGELPHIAQDSARRQEDKSLIYNELTTLATRRQEDKSKIYNELATHAPKLTKEDGKIDWSKSAREIYNLVRGTLPWPGAYTYYNGKMIKIISCEVAPRDDQDGAISMTLPGTITVTPGKIEVATEDGKLIVDEVQPASKRKMNAGDFINGYRLKTGVRFGTE